MNIPYYCSYRETCTDMEITPYWLAEVCGSGSLNSPGMTGRWNSLLFL